MNPLTTVFAVCATAVAAALALQAQLDAGPVPAAAAPVSEAARAGKTTVATPPTARPAPRCKDRLRVDIKTRASSGDAGRVVIGAWEDETRWRYGPEWASFRDAVAPVARCRGINDDAELSCWAEGGPCMSCEAIAAAAGGSCSRSYR